MLRTRPSSVRRTALLGVSTVVLALGSSALAVPGASAVDSSASSSSSASASASADASSSASSSVPSQDNGSPNEGAEAKHDENFKFLEYENIIDWTDYKVTGEHEITFTTLTGTPRCYDVRAEVVEKDGVMNVALVEGTILGAPDACTAEARIAKVKVKTKAKASTLKVQQLPESLVRLNKGAIQGA